jgi:hypothetical protein
LIRAAASTTTGPGRLRQEAVQGDRAVLDVASVVEAELHHGVVGLDTPEQINTGLGVLDRLEPTIGALGAL